MSSFQISVVIPTRNRAMTLSKALVSLLRQELDQSKFEVIVVDNGSTDQTATMCLEHAKEFANFQMIHVGEPGLHLGRHAGLKASAAEIVCFADDDIEATPGWLVGVLEAFGDSTVGLVGGKNLPKWEAEPPHWLWEKWQTSVTPWGRSLGSLSLLDFGDSILEIDPYYVYGCNFSIRKGILLEAGGFHPDGMPQSLIAYRGDGESHVSGYVKRSRYSAVYNPKASVYHLVPSARMCQDYFQRRAFYQGISDSYSLIRRQGGVCAPSQPSLFAKIWQKLIGDFLLRRDIYQLRQDLARSELDRAVGRSRRAGFYFHQNLCSRDPSLLKWVLRESYL